MVAFIEHTSCVKCSSSDARAVYDDGHSYCFACHSYFAGDGEQITVPTESAKQLKESRMQAAELYNRGEIRPLPNRNISRDTCLKYGVKVVQVAGAGVSHLYPYYLNNKLIAVKQRKVETKDFLSYGDQKAAELFGQHLFPAGGDKYITVCEGEEDALAAYEMMGSKFAVVSPRNGTGSALKDAKAAYEYLDSFQNIRLCFDADEAGRKAAEQVAGLFSPGKVSIVQLSDKRDPCDYLKAGKTKEFMDKWWKAETYTPAGIVAGKNLKTRLANRPKPVCFDYPWKGLNSLTYGMRAGELVTLTGGSGLGKTSILREIVYGLLKSTQDNIGCMFLEETIEDSGLGIMGMAVDKRLDLPDTQYTAEEFDTAFAQTLGTDRLFYFDHFGSTSIDELLARARYFVKSLDCKHLILDHISIVVSAQQNADERKALDEITTKLKTFVLECGVSLLVVSHVRRVSGKAHEEGGQTSLGDLRGTAAIGQLSNIVIGLERNGQDPDPLERNTTTVRVLKNRFTGATGPACRLRYDNTTGRLTELDIDVEQFGDDNDDGLEELESITA